MHNPEDVLGLLRKMASFFNGASKGQSFSCFVLRHVPHATERLIQKFEEFMVECIHEYKAIGNIEEGIKFEQRQEFLIVKREIDLALSKLFWGSLNNNRDLLSAEQWIRMNQIAVELTYILDLLKGEFYYGSKANSCSH